MPTRNANVEPMQMDAGEENDNYAEEEVHTLVENPTTDVETLISGFVGMAKLLRLRFVADHCPALKKEALKLALVYVQTTFNINMYLQIHRRLQPHSEGFPQALLGLAPGVPCVDQEWVTSTRRKAEMKLEKLDAELKGYKANSIKESIRRGHDDLGNHHLDMGDLNNAMKWFSRARDYCTKTAHILSMCLNVIVVSVYLQNWPHVLSYVSKAEALPEMGERSPKLSIVMIRTKLTCASGLAELALKRYKSAAKFFVQANIDHCLFPELLSANNVAVYGGLCALASYERQELKKNVISNSSFKLFLELEPQLRDVIINFYESDYASCLRLLAEMKDNLLLDIYLASHVDALYAAIRNRALSQYFSPYLSADMRRMASAFNTTVRGLEDELMTLIMEGQIAARIDSRNKILLAKDADQRRATYEKALLMGKDFVTRTRALIVRSAVRQSGIHVPCPPRDPIDDSDGEMTEEGITSTEAVEAMKS